MRGALRFLPVLQAQLPRVSGGVAPILLWTVMPLDSGCGGPWWWDMPRAVSLSYSPQENDFGTGLPFVGKGLPTYPRIFFWKPIV